MKKWPPKNISIFNKYLNQRKILLSKIFQIINKEKSEESDL